MPARLALAGVRKRFGTTTALAPLTLELPAGSIHGLLGENGAGKSTLVRIVAGALAPDAGTVRIDGVPLAPADPRAARRAGVGVVHQHFALVGALSVAENLRLGRTEVGSRWLRPRALAAEARRLAERHALAIGDPRLACHALPVGTQARVEILRALTGAPTVLLLDEPTAVLAPAEVAELFATMRKLRDAGMLIVFITHKIAEALAVCDRVSVLRAGELLTTVAAAEASASRLASLMVGEERAAAAEGAAAASDREDRPPATAAMAVEAMHSAPVVVGAPTRGGGLRVSRLATAPERGRVALDGVTLEIAPGEITGIAGVDGNGQEELVAAITGLVPRRGEIAVDGVALLAEDVAAAQRAGIAVIPADRRGEGLALDLPVWENVLLSAPLLARVTRHGLVERRPARALARRIAAEWRIVHADLDQPIAALSGGNQQRVVIGRALAETPRVLVAVNPTRGLDIAAAAQVHATLRAAAEAGAAVLLVSTDLDELAAIATRAFALFRGRLAGPLAPRDRDAVGAAMAGLEA